MNRSARDTPEFAQPRAQLPASVSHVPLAKPQQEQHGKMSSPTPQPFSMTNRKHHISHSTGKEQPQQPRIPFHPLPNTISNARPLSQISHQNASFKVIPLAPGPSTSLSMPKPLQSTHHPFQQQQALPASSASHAIPGPLSHHNRAQSTGNHGGKSTSTGRSKDGKPGGTRKKTPRKEKSLGNLSKRFITLYSSLANTGDKENVENPDKDQSLVFITLDEAAAQLDVEKRRIYDIVNVLESVNVLEKRNTSLFVWRGFQDLHNTLRSLRTNALGSQSLHDGIHSLSMEDKDNEILRRALPLFKDSAKGRSLSNSSIKPDKSLSNLCQRFIQVYLVTQCEFITLEQAVQVLISPQTMTDASRRTRVRRLQDTTNILASIDLVRKVSAASSTCKKQGFQWIGDSLSAFSTHPEKDNNQAGEANLILRSHNSNSNNNNDSNDNDDSNTPKPNMPSSHAEVPLKKRKRLPRSGGLVTSHRSKTLVEIRQHIANGQQLQQSTTDTNAVTMGPAASHTASPTNHRTIVPQIEAKTTLSTPNSSISSDITSSSGTSPRHLGRTTTLNFQFRSPPAKRRQTASSPLREQHYATNTYTTATTATDTHSSVSTVPNHEKGGLQRPVLSFLSHTKREATCPGPSPVSDQDTHSLRQQSNNTNNSGPTPLFTKSFFSTMIRNISRDRQQYNPQYPLNHSERISSSYDGNNNTIKKPALVVTLGDEESQPTAGNESTTSGTERRALYASRLGQRLNIRVGDTNTPQTTSPLNRSGSHHALRSGSSFAEGKMAMRRFRSAPRIQSQGPHSRDTQQHHIPESPSHTAAPSQTPPIVNSHQLSNTLTMLQRHGASLVSNPPQQQQFNFPVSKPAAQTIPMGSRAPLRYLPPLSEQRTYLVPIYMPMSPSMLQQFQQQNMHHQDEGQSHRRKSDANSTDSKSPSLGDNKNIV